MIDSDVRIDTVQEQTNDYPISPIPQDKRGRFLGLSMVLLGFTFYTGTMASAATLGAAFSFKSLMWIIFWGDLILGVYAGILSWCAAKSGLTTSLMARYSFGKYGALWVDFLLGGSQVGWYGYSTALTATAIGHLLGLDSWIIALMILFGFGFGSTAFVGYRGMAILSYVAVPAMSALIFWSMGIAVVDAGGWAALVNIQPTSENSMTIGAALTIVVGTYVSGGLQATNWSRFAKSGKSAVIATMLAFFLGNAFMLVSGAFGAFVYQEPDIVKVLSIQHLLGAGIMLLLLNIWTSQDNTIYAFSIAACSAFHSKKRRRMVLIGAAIGTCIAIAGIYNALVPFLVFLGSVIPPIGGIIAVDFFFVNKRNYTAYEKAAFRKFNWNGIIAYFAGIACAEFLPGITSINAGIGGAVVYFILTLITRARPVKEIED